jgi:predicted  nucleic acid-binding Zn-ribbon protein
MAEPTERIAILLELQQQEFEKKAKSAGAAIDRLERKFSPLAAAEAKLEKQQLRFNAALEAGTIDVAKHAKGLKLAQREYDITAAKLNQTRSKVVAMNGSVSQLGKGALSMGKNLAFGLAGGAITAAFAGITRNISSTVRGVANIGNEAKRSGLDVATFQEWSYVADKNRLSVDSLVDGFKELNLRVDEFVVTGVGPAAEALNRLGYTSDELKKKIKDPSALMLEMLDRMEGLSKAAQIRVSDELFGGTAGERFVELLGQGRGELAGLIQEAHDVGAVLDSEMIDKADEIERRYNELALRVTAAWQQMAVGMADAVDDAARTTFDDFFSDSLGGAVLGQGTMDKLKGAGDLTKEQSADLEALKNNIDGVISKYGDLSASLESLSEGARRRGFGDIADTLDQSAHNMSSLAFQIDNGMITLDEFNGFIEDTALEADDALASLESVAGADMSSVRGQVSRLTQDLSIATGQANALKAAMPGTTVSPGTPEQSALLSEIKALGDQAASNDAYISEQKRLQSLTKDQLALEREISSVRKDAVKDGALLTDQQIAEIAAGNISSTAARAPTSGGGSSGDGKSRQSFSMGLKDTRSQIDEMLAEAKALNDLTFEYDQYGVAIAVAKKKTDLLNKAKQDGQKITPELEASVSSLAEQYVLASEKVDEAKSRHEALNSTIQDFKSATIDAAMGSADAMDAFKDSIKRAAIEYALFGTGTFANISGGGGGEGGGLLGGIIGGLLGGARANGGPVSAGTPYLVNENTANSEVFVPSQNGAILNVPQAQKALSGGAASQVKVLVEVYVEDDGALGVIAQQAGAEGGAMAAVQVVQRNNQTSIDMQGRP